jgi:hypothetical protein
MPGPDGAVKSRSSRRQALPTLVTFYREGNMAARLKGATMRKPLNNYAFTVWLMAIGYALLMIPEVVELFRQPSFLESRSSANYVESFQVRDIFGLLRNTVSGSGSLLALGAIIELIDRILWEARTRTFS